MNFTLAAAARKRKKKKKKKRERAKKKKRYSAPSIVQCNIGTLNQLKTMGKIRLFTSANLNACEVNLGNSCCCFCFKFTCVHYFLKCRMVTFYRLFSATILSGTFHSSWIGLHNYFAKIYLFRSSFVDYYSERAQCTSYKSSIYQASWKMHSFSVIYYWCYRQMAATICFFLPLKWRRRRTKEKKLNTMKICSVVAIDTFSITRWVFFFELLFGSNLRICI